MTEENKKESQTSDARPYKGEGGGSGELAGVLFGLIMFGALYLTAQNAKNPDPNKEADAQEQLRSALKDPAMTDRIIEQIKKPETQEILADPAVMANMQKLVDGIEDDQKETLDAMIERLNERKKFFEDATPKKNWAKKAIEQASDKKTAERE